MSFRRLALSSLALAALAAFTARDAGAQTTMTTFDTVDSFQVQNNSWSVTGVVHGAAAASTLQFQISESYAVTQSCERAINVMLNRPGRFSLGIYGNNAGLMCKLTRTP